MIYPLILLIFTTLRRIVEIGIKHLYPTFSCLLPFLIYIAQFTGGFFVNRCTIISSRSNTNETILGIQLIYESKMLRVDDSNAKIIVLLILISLFDFVGTSLRKNFLPKEYTKNSLTNRARSFQLLISGLLCYFAMNIKIYRHQKFSIVIIIICLTIIVSVDFLYKILEEEEEIYVFYSLGIAFFSCFCRAFLILILTY
jgi:hypothetical protein